jgi:hypothetical protein
MNRRQITVGLMTLPTALMSTSVTTHALKLSELKSEIVLLKELHQAAWLLWKAERDRCLSVTWMRKMSECAITLAKKRYLLGDLERTLGVAPSGLGWPSENI